MPIYEYQCDSCSVIMEDLQKFSDPALRECPACGGKLSKLMSLNSFHLKGSGWYVTDYTNKNSPRASESTDSIAKSASGSDTSSDSTSKSASSSTSSESSKTEKKVDKKVNKN